MADSVKRLFSEGADTTSKIQQNNLCETADQNYNNLNENFKGTSIVELDRKGVPLGLTISGGADKCTRPKISSLRPGSVAHRSDCLAVGDYVTSVNGIRTYQLKHDEVVALVKNAGDKVILEVEYEIPSLSAEGPLCACSKIIQLQLEKENDSFGFTLRGGVCNNNLKCSALTITHVWFGGPADREGSIKCGDRLLAVDGINLTGSTLQEALSVLRQLNHTAIFTVEYDVSIIDTVKNASGPLLVEIDKTPGCLLGINLTCLQLPEPTIIIESIRQASIAERCGALHVGDHVLAIDNHKTDLMSSVEAMQLLKSSKQTMKLEIFPASQMVPRRNPGPNVKQGGTIPHYIAARASFTNSCYNTLSSLASLVTPVNEANPPVCHTDTIEVILPSSHKGFGLTIKCHSLTCSMVSSPFINSIENGSCADKSGVLQVGDRILAVNGEYVYGLLFDEITQLILHSHPKLLLKTEFNVTEAVVPNSGTFVVKLVKKGESALGITLTAPKNRQAGDPLIIAAVEKGSVAHRSGTIQPGDKLLAIDSIRMENCTVDDAMTILLSCNDIATLRIRKDESFSDDPDVTTATIYTVELARHGGPLGITVSGAEEPFVPISISGLIENGLAERTGALHVGDKILAINGTCLRGKPLSEAVKILQSCGDIVTLKISRTPEFAKFDDDREKLGEWAQSASESHMKTFTSPLSSVDSAVESWDSYNLELYNGIKAECDSRECLNSKPDLYLLNTSHHSSAKESSNRLCVPNSWNIRNVGAESSHDLYKSQSLLSENGKENWSKALEDLQTCGQSQLLRQIEYKILGNDENLENCDSQSSCRNHISKCPLDTLSEQSLQKLNAQIEQLESGLSKGDGEGSIAEFTFPVPSSHECINECINNFSSDNISCNSVQHPSPLFAFPVPIEVHKVVLFKDQVYEDFGFSISDGLYEHGVYINRIRAGGPADASGLIRPYDRILQVNNIKTYDHDCCLTVPLIASSGDHIELVISRPACENDSSSETTIGRDCISQPWINDSDQDDFLSRLNPFVKTQTFTKTL